MKMIEKLQNSWNHGKDLGLKKIKLVTMFDLEDCVKVRCGVCYWCINIPSCGWGNVAILHDIIIAQCSWHSVRCAFDLCGLFTTHDKFAPLNTIRLLPAPPSTLDFILVGIGIFLMGFRGGKERCLTELAGEDRSRTQIRRLCYNSRASFLNKVSLGVFTWVLPVSRACQDSSLFAFLHSIFSVKIWVRVREGGFRLMLWQTK